MDNFEEYVNVADDDEEFEKVVAPASSESGAIGSNHAAMDREYNLVEALLKAADFESDITKVEIKRQGQFLFAVNIKPISDEEARMARKKATKMLPNPNGKKLPKIEGEFNSSLFNSWIIYLATTEEDKKQIWGNKTIMDKFDILEPVDTIDKLLTFGEKSRLSDLVAEISGMDDDDDMTEEEYAKN